MLAQINAISRGYGLHLPLVMLDKQGSQIGNWNEEAERNLTTYLNGIEDTSQVLFTVKAYVNLNKNLPQEFKNMVKFIMDKTDCLFHVQIMEYTGTTPGPRYEIEKEERWRGVLALLKTFNTNYPTRLFVSRGNEPFLDGNHEWTDTIESFREWQFAFNETAKELGFKVGISNEASLTNTLETLRVALLQNRPIDLISAHVYRPKTNHPNHVQTFVKSIQHLCMLAKRKVPMIALTENSFTIQEPTDPSQYLYWAYKHPQQCSINGVYSCYFVSNKLSDNCYAMLHKSQNDLIRDISTIPQGTIETPYSQNERVRNAQLATHQSLTSLIAPPKVWYLTSAGIAAYYQNF